MYVPILIITKYQMMINIVLPTLSSHDMKKCIFLNIVQQFIQDLVILDLGMT